MVAIVEKPFRIVAGDEWQQSFLFKQDNTLEDLTVEYESWRADWNPKYSVNKPIQLRVDTDFAADGEIIVSATPEQTAMMVGEGVCDLRSFPGPLTIIRFYTDTLEDQQND